MPSFTPKGGSGSEEGGGPRRTTFRPPWVKEGAGPPGAPWVRETPPPIPAPPAAPWLKEVPPPIPAPPSAPWLRRHDSKPDHPQVQEKLGLKKPAKVIPIQQEKPDVNGKPEVKEDALKKTVRAQPSSEENKQKVIPIRVEHERPGPEKRKPGFQQEKEEGKVIGRKQPEQERKVPIQEKKPLESERKFSVPERKVSIPERKVSIPERKQAEPERKASIPERKFAEPEKKMSIPKPPPQPERKAQVPERKGSQADPAVPAAPQPPRPPPPPPAPGGQTPITVEKAAKLEALRARPRRRPDWTDMMKEVEDGVKLKHVKCNDRSAPVLPKAKAKGQFVYESEKDNVHNQLLKQIQMGVRLKKVRTNDRSRPMLQGLRKFRRQMTIEEQIQKSASVADVVAVATEPDELDDIDKVRDDLQSTKQMLALELRNKEALERENKRLMARLLNLEVELEKEKMTKEIEKEKGNVVQVRTLEDDKLITKLKEEASQSAKMAKEMEEMYRKTAEELDVTRAKLESAWLHNSQLEMTLKSLEKRGEGIPLLKQQSKKSITSIPNARPRESSSEEEEEEEFTETETETEEEDAELAAAQQEKRAQRELKLLFSKVRTLKEKRSAALKEKSNLKEQFSKLHSTLKEERRKYKELQKEVDKMAKLIKDVDEEGEENEGEESEEEEEKEVESESESESEDTEEDEESEGEMPDGTPMPDKVTHLQRRIKENENRLMTLKKSNYLLKANIDRRQDDLNRQKEMALSLQEDLNSVLAELG